MTDAIDAEILFPLIDRNQKKPGGLSEILLGIQGHYGFLPEAALRVVAERTHRSLSDVYAFTSFGDTFRLQPPPRQSVPDVQPASSTRVVRCRWCNHSLLDRDCWIGGRPSVRVDISFRQEYGSLWFSSEAGRFDIRCEFDIPHDGEVDLFCPHCSAEIFTAQNCTECGAPMIPMLFGAGAILPVCSSTECGSRQIAI